MTPSLTRGAAFLTGFGLAFLPAVGPFVAIIFFLSSRWRFQRTDALWLLAAFGLALPLGVHEGTRGFGFGLLQVLGPWLVYRSFFRLRDIASLHRNASLVTGGLVTGLAFVVGLGWLRVEQINVAYKTLAQAIVWESSPIFYGHAVFILGAIIAVLTPSARYRLLSLGLAALGILVSGSREAALAWVGVVIASFFLRRSSGRARLGEIGLLSLMLTVLAGLGPL